MSEIYLVECLKLIGFCDGARLAEMLHFPRIVGTVELEGELAEVAVVDADWMS